MTGDRLIWSGRTPCTIVPADDRGLAYGDGLFETVRVTAGKPVLGDWHLARLELGCERLGLPWQDFWPQALHDFCRERGDGIAKLLVTRGSGGRGYQPPAEPEPLTVLSWHALPTWPARAIEDGVRVRDAALRLGEQPMLAGLKHLNRLEQVLLRAELARHPDCHEAVVRDARGYVIEAVSANLFFVSDGILHTPSLARCGVAGVLREALLDACANLGLLVQVGDWTRDSVFEADEVFLASSVIGIWPVRQWDDRTWRPGPITRQCQALIAPWFATA